MANVAEINRDIAAAKLEVNLALRVLKGGVYGDTNAAVHMLEEANRRLEWATNELLKN